MGPALAAVPAPRRPWKNLRHPLVDVLVLGCGGVLCGCADCVAVETLGRKQEDCCRRFLELPAGIPAHDTFRRVFQAVGPQALQRCWIQWLPGVRPAAPAAGQVVAIAGKPLRRTFDRGQGLGALHRESAGATATGLTLGPGAVDAKSNAITAIPRRIELLDLKDGVVTIDAAGGQKDIAVPSVAQAADYVLALQENQPTLSEQVSDYFREQLEKEGPARKLRHPRQVAEGHGRRETRATFVAPATKDNGRVGSVAGMDDGRSGDSPLRGSRHGPAP